MVASMRDYIFTIAPQVARSAFAACEAADVILHSFLFTAGAHSWAREHGIPDVSIQTFPIFAPTRAFPNAALAQLPPGILSLLSHWLATQTFRLGSSSGYDRVRRLDPEAAFPARLYWPFDASRPPHSRTPLLFGYSPVVLPRPREWEAHIHVTGYFFLEEGDYQPPVPLAGFLAVGPPPVCISFGSMVNREAERVTRTVLEALARTGDRAVILTGWGGWKPEHPPEAVFFMDDAPHGWLFPRCKTVIHHGGAGTTGAGLRAGVPNVVIPHTADQPFWGNRVHAIGAGPRPIPVSRLTVDRLVGAMAEAQSPAIRNDAQAAGRSIRAEAGVGQAVRLIERHAEDWRQQSE
jgi:sterol 3beta-glucosyltransferase